MKKRWVEIAAAVALLVAGVLLLQGGQAWAEEDEDDAWYWQAYDYVFNDWDDEAPAGSAKTEVAGVRGMGVEESLGDEGYDWKAVLQMEKFKVSNDKIKQHLKEGKLGPYQGK